MRRGIVAFSALTLVGLALSGCGLFRFEQREPWRTQAEEACIASGEVKPSAYVARASRIEGNGACGIDYPFKVSAFASGGVGLKRPVTLACPMIPRIDTWLEEVVRPAGALYFGVPVTDVRAGTYSCRPRNNQRGAKLSEHSFGNAIDVMSFILGDGREITVKQGWRGDAAEQDFLREVFVGACRYFTTVLGPGADAFHSDHIHLDLARHDPRGVRGICKPLLKFTPRLDGTRPSPRRPQVEPGEVPPGEYEEEGPFDENQYSHRQTTPPATAQAMAPRQTYRPPPAVAVRPEPQPSPVLAPPPSRPVMAQGASGGFSADLPAPGRGLPPAPGAAPMALRPGPVYGQAPVAGQSPQWLNGHGLY